MAEYVSRMWVVLPCLSRSDPLMRIGEHMSRWCVALQCLSRSEFLIRRGWTCVQAVSPSSMFEQIATTNKNGAKKHLQNVSSSPVFSGLELLTRMADHLSSLWAPLLFLSRSEPLTSNLICIQAVSISSVSADQNYWQKCLNIVFRMWVPLQFFSRSEPLTRMVEHTPACESCSSVWADQNDWQEWLNTHPECVSCSSFGITDMNGWTCI